VLQRRLHARAVLTRGFFEREYITAGKTLRQISAETGYPCKFLAECARAHGITPASASGPAPIDPDWLREQYTARMRSWTGIAAQLGVTVMTVIAAARRHRIPSRPPGVHSRPEMITRLPAGIPADIRCAVDGGLKGWHRLQRFQVAMTFPSIEAAATYLGAHQSALIHQFRRLEQDIGSPLYHRSTTALPPPAHAANQPRRLPSEGDVPARRPGAGRRARISAGASRAPQQR
jgi:hypothetical protein